MGEEGGWETIKRRRGRRAPAVPRDVVKRDKADGRTREEVLSAFGRAEGRWRAEWEGLPCREELRRILERIKPDLDPGTGKGCEEPKTDGGESVSGEGTGTHEPPRKDTPQGGGDGKKAPRWPRHLSGLSCAVCLGIGSFEDEGWEVVRRTWVQYFAFLAIVEALDPSLPVIFQEPDFTPGDRTFLESRGHVVLEDPLGFEAIAGDPRGCVLAGFHLYAPVYRRALEAGLPRVFVGTGWDVWDNINKGDEIPALKTMDATHRSEDFPQDQAVSTFSSTSIYWLPGASGASDEKGEADPREEEEHPKKEGHSKDRGGSKDEGEEKDEGDETGGGETGEKHSQDG